MSKNDNQKLQAEEENNSKLFKDDVDYEQPSEDRPYFYWVGKTKLYVNKEQFKFLTEDDLNEKQEKWIKSRCLVPSQRGKYKICYGKCEECPSFLNGWTKPTYGGFEEIDEEEYLKENPQISIEDEIIKTEQIRAMYDAINKLEDPIDRYIIRQYLLEKRDAEVAAEIGKSRRTLINYRNQIIEKLKRILKNF